MKTFAPLIAALLLMPAAARADAIKDIDLAGSMLVRQILKRTDIKGKNVAILPFENPENVATELGRLISEGMEDGVINSGRFTVLDRAYVTRMMNEIAMSASGLTDARTAIEIGKMKAAAYLLVGRTEPIGRKRLRVKVRLLETATAKLVATAKADMRFSRDLRALYAQAAVLDAAAVGFFGEESSGDVVFIDRPGKSCKWIEAKAKAPVRGDPAAARAAAIALARRKATQKLLGQTPSAEPNFSESAFRGQLEKVLRATRSSRVSEESIVDEGRQGKDYHVTIETCLRPLNRKNKDFRVELMLNQNRFFSGQEASAILTTTKNAYIYLFSVDFDQNATRVFPVEGARGHRSKAGKPFIYPSERHRKDGVTFGAELPEGAGSSIEMLRVVAVRRDVEKLLDDAKTYPEVVRKLEGSGAAWAEDVRVFTIYTP